MFDNNVPVPAKTRNSYHFDKMAVGDSQFIPSVTTAKVYSSLTNAKKRTGFKFTVKKLVENDVQGVRVWRTE